MRDSHIESLETEGNVSIIQSFLIRQFIRPRKDI